MPTARPTTIEINLGTRYIGIAVIVGTELREWRLKVVGGNTLIEKFRRLTLILAPMVDSYQPIAMGLKKCHPSKSSPILDRLELDVKAYLQGNGIGVQE